MTDKSNVNIESNKKFIDKFIWYLRIIANKRLRNRILFKSSFVLFLILMFLFPTASLTGAKKGLLLWFNTVLPTLLPFIIISTLIVRLNITKQLCTFIYPILGRLFRISKQGCYPIVIGFLSGIPMGAKTSADLLKKNKISKEEAQYLLNLCNNASPMFIMGYIVLSELQAPKLKLPLLALLYSSSVISATSYRLFTYLKKKRESSREKSSLVIASCSKDVHKVAFEDEETLTKLKFSMVDEAIGDGFEVITKVGGYIILFSVLAQIAFSVEGIPLNLRLLLVGFSEITIGIHSYAASELSTTIKIVLISAITAFGGFSGIAQTNSVIADSGLSIRTYIIVKCINFFVALLLTLLYVV